MSERATHAPASRTETEQRDHPGPTGLRRVLADARPDRATAVHRPNRNGGRDLVVGDVHGHFPTLERALTSLRFEAGRDRLFSVGDLIDRGPESARAVEWLESGRITAAVRGNHEQMMCDALAFDATLALRTLATSATWLGNGGHWWHDHPEVERERERRGSAQAFPLGERWAAVLRELPYMMVIETAHGRVGVVHASGFANFMRSWDVVWEDAQRLSAGETAHPKRPAARQQSNLLWADAEVYADQRDDERLREAPPGIDLIVTGHSPGPHPCWTRTNVLCIDTGVHYDEWGHLTVAEVQGPESTLHRVAREGVEVPGT